MAFALVGFGCHLAAQSAEPVDQESLVSKADAVIEGTVADRGGGRAFTALTVDSVIHGDALHPKDLIEVDLQAYSRAFHAGDHLILLLTRKSQRSGLPPSFTERVWWSPTYDGVSVVDGDKVHTFAWQPRRGNFEDTASTSGAGALMGLGDYRKALGESVQHIVDLESRIRNAEDRKDSLVLLEMLKARSPQPLSGRNVISDGVAEKIAQGMAELHDYAALVQALDVGGGEQPFDRSEAMARGYGLAAVEGGLATKEGAAYLLKQIGDETAATVTRARCAHALPWAGVIYGDHLEGADNAHYLAKMAALEMQTARGPEISYELLIKFLGAKRGVDRPSRGPGAGFKADLAEAVGVLAQAHAAATTEETKFAAEASLALLDSAAFRKLNTPCGPVVGIMRNRAVKKRIPRTIPFLGEIVPADMDAADPQQMMMIDVVFESLTTGKQYFSTCTNGGGSMGMEEDPFETASIPPDAPAGKYRMYYRWTINGKVVGTGHPLEVQW